MSIYNEMIQLEQMLYDCADEETGEIKQADDEAYHALMKELAENGLEKLAKIKANKEAYLSSVALEINRLQSQAKRAKKSLEWIEDYMLKIYEKAPKDNKGKVQAGTFTVGVRKSDRLIVDDEQSIPDEFMRIKKEVDKASIKDANKQGKSFSFAHIEQVQHLNIK